MKKSLLVLLTLVLVVFVGCSEGTTAPEVPTDGVVFLIVDNGNIAFDEYEIQLRRPDSTRFDILLERKNGYQRTWHQKKVDEEEGNSYNMTAYKAELEGNKVVDLDKPLTETRKLTFKEGTTNEGRLILLEVSQ